MERRRRGGEEFNGLTVDAACAVCRLQMSPDDAETQKTYQSAVRTPGP